MSSLTTRLGLNNNAKPVFEVEGLKGSEIITDTAAHSAGYTNFVALIDTVVASAIGNTNPANGGFTVKAGVEVRGVWSSITLASGAVQAFYT